MATFEVRAWPRKGSPQVALNINAETELALTPEEADTMARQLLWNAQFVRHHIKRQRGNGDPLQHLTNQTPVGEFVDFCPFTLPGDVTFERGGTEPAGRGSTFARCAHCYGPNPPADVKL